MYELNVNRSDSMNFNERSKHNPISEKEKPAMKFQLVNADGTPLTISISDSESEELTGKSDNSNENDKEEKKQVNKEEKKQIDENEKEEKKQADKKILQKNLSEKLIGKKLIDKKEEKYINDKKNNQKSIDRNDISKLNDKKNAEKPTNRNDISKSNDKKKGDKLIDKNDCNDFNNKDIQKKLIDQEICNRIMNDQDYTDLLFCESDDLQDITEFRRFLQLNMLLKMLPDITDEYVKETVDGILSCKERKAVIINFIQKNNIMACAAEKLKMIKEKKESQIERARNELNRVTSGNVQHVIRNLLAIRVQKVDDMKEIASCFFDKSIKEVVYQEVYIQILNALKKTWKSVEEEQMVNKSQTCFFGWFLRLGIEKLKSKQNWSKRPNSASTQAEEDDLEAERLKAKKHYIGTINLFIKLYELNIIGPSNIISVIDHLCEVPTPENLESIALISTSLGIKFASNDRFSVIKKMQAYLTKNQISPTTRLGFIIENALESIKNALKGTAKPIENNNVFAGLKTVEECVPSQQKPPRSIQTKEADVSEKIFAISKKVSPKIFDNDYTTITKEILESISAFGSDAIFLEFFKEITSNYHKSEALIHFFLNHLVTYAPSLFPLLIKLKEDIPSIEIDFPFAKKNYATFISKLSNEKLISNSEYDNLK